MNLTTEDRDFLLHDIGNGQKPIIPAKTDIWSPLSKWHESTASHVVVRWTTMRLGMSRTFDMIHETLVVRRAKDLYVRIEYEKADLDGQRWKCVGVYVGPLLPGRNNVPHRPHLRYSNGSAKWAVTGPVEQVREHSNKLIERDGKRKRIARMDALDRTIKNLREKLEAAEAELAELKGGSK